MIHKKWLVLSQIQRILFFLGIIQSFEELMGRAKCLQSSLFWVRKRPKTSFVSMKTRPFFNGFRCFFAGIFLVLVHACSGQELRIYPADFQHFSGSELRWPVGNKLELTCQIDAHPDLYNLVWYLPQAQGRSTNITMKNGRSNLKLGQISAQDTGPYKCKAEKLVASDKLPNVPDKTLILTVQSTSGNIFKESIRCNFHQQFLPILKEFEAIWGHLEEV